MSSVRITEARAALDALAAVDVSSCDRVGLDEVVGVWRQVRGFTDAYELLIARRSRELAEVGESECAEDVLADHGRRSTRDARAAANRERVAVLMPVFEEALAAGVVSTGHLDALAAATLGLDEVACVEFVGFADALLAEAEHGSVEAFGRVCRELARNVSHDGGESRVARQRKACRLRQWVDRVTGMYHIHAELDPESGAKAWAAITAATSALRHTNNTTNDDADVNEDDPAPANEPVQAPLFAPSDDAEPAEDEASCWGWHAAMAFVGLLSGSRLLDRRVPEVAVHIDWATLQEGWHDQSLCETSDGTELSPSAVRRLCCEAEIFPVVLDGPSELMDVGRAQRSATREQRRALRAMYRSCGYPGCGVGFDACEVHHVVWWEHLGESDLANLLPLCSLHHHQVHEGGWNLQLSADRIVTVTRPDGTVHFTGTTTNRTPTPHPGERRTAA